MFRYVRWAIRLIFIALIVGFLDYYLPSKDVVRIVGTDVKRMDVRSREMLAEDNQYSSGLTRDVRFVNAVWPDDRPRVYRNEETGWGFPWYFKFDSGNLQTIAQDMRSTREQAKWVIITSYGWRIEILSMFPNAVKIIPAEGPGQSVFSWIRAVFIGISLIIALVVWRAWRVFMRQLHQDHRFANGETGIGQIFRWLMANFKDWWIRVRPG